MFLTGLVCSVWWNFYPDYTCLINTGCETNKDSNLKINNLPLNNSFSYRNVIQNSVNALSKMALKISFFLLKSSNLCALLTIQFLPACGPNVWRNFRLTVSAFATAARKSFIGKYTVKTDFPKENFMLPLLTLTMTLEV